VLVVLTVSLSFCLRAYKYNTTITKRAKLKNVRRCFVCGILGEFFVSSKRHKYTTSHKQTKTKNKTWAPPRFVDCLREKASSSSSSSSIRDSIYQITTSRKHRNHDERDERNVVFFFVFDVVRQRCPTKECIVIV